MTFETKLRSWIESNFPKLNNFSSLMGIQQSTLSRYLKGEQKPGYEFLDKIRKLGCDLNWLLDDDKSLLKEPFIKYEAKEDYKEVLSELHEITKIANKLEVRLKKKISD